MSSSLRCTVQAHKLLGNKEGPCGQIIEILTRYPGVLTELRHQEGPVPSQLFWVPVTVHPHAPEWQQFQPAANSFHTMRKSESHRGTQLIGEPRTDNF